MSYPSSAAYLPLASIRGLSVKYLSGSRLTAALLDIDLDIAPGEIVGILGESGSGKSTLALSLLGLLPANANVEGAILFQDVVDSNPRAEDLLGINEDRWGAIRGAKISMIFQEPGLALSPVMRVGEQIAEVLRAHRHGDKEWRKREIAAILQRVRLSDAERICNAYPHQLSGGELHRVAIAQALACRPSLIIADEPTRSLDVTLQADVLQLLREIHRELGSALVFITHDPSLLVGFADRVIVMYAGRVVEEGPVQQVFQRPLHPYTRALLQLVPQLAGNSGNSQRRLPAIPGRVGELDRLRRGCAFEPRCSSRTSVCREDSPTLDSPEPGRRVSCFNHGN
jgi:oligopeptide/dipeptide ABC transporter ATP-binding protein